MKAPSSPVGIHLSTLRQPHVQITLAKMYWAIFDSGVVGGKTDFRDRPDQIRFQSHDMITVCFNPSAPLQRDRVGNSVDSDLVRADVIRPIGPLTKM